MGYLLAVVEFVGFLVGGAATFGFIEGLPLCAVCGFYLRKLKTKKTKELTLDEAAKIFELFKDGDVSTVAGVITWAPDARSLDRKAQTAIITFDLYGCPKCKSEMIATKINAFNGKEWKEVPKLAIRRGLANGLSLRDRFG